MLNSVCLQGRIPFEVRYFDYNSKNGQGLGAGFKLMVKRDRKENGAEHAEDDGINCLLFGQGATYLQKYGSKDAIYIIHGRLQTKKAYEADGVKHDATLEVLVSDIYICGGTSGGNNVENNSDQKSANSKPTNNTGNAGGNKANGLPPLPKLK